MSGVVKGEEMSGLVEEIQRGATSTSVPLSVLLRQVKVAARKLNLSELETWVSHEAGGYPNVESLPDYRRATGVLKAWNPYHGWIPFTFPDAKTEQLFSACPVLESVSSLEALSLGSPNIYQPVPDGMVRLLTSGNRSGFGEVIMQISPGTVAHILESVRGRILDWALDLESAGVVGDQMSFEKIEVDRAQSVTFHITNTGTIAGPLGVGNSARDISVSAVDSTALSKVVDQLYTSIDEIARDGANKEDLQEKLDILRSEITKEAPSQLALRAGALALRDVLVAASGNIAASGAITLIRSALGA